MARANRNDIPVEVKKVGPAPAFLAETAGDDSIAILKKHIVLQRLTIIQAMTPSELKNVFPERTTILTPGRILLAEPGTSFKFVPVFFFEEYCKWKDRNDKSEGSPVVDRTFDPTHEIARKALDKNKRMEPYEEGSKMNWRYVEHLNYIGFLYGGDKHETPIVVSFARGENFNGKNFATAISMRKMEGITVPLWAQVWELEVGLHKNRKGQEWWGFDFSPAEPSIITDEQAPSYKAEFIALKEAHAERRIIVDHTGSDEAEDETDTEGQFS